MCGQSACSCALVQQGTSALVVHLHTNTPLLKSLDDCQHNMFQNLNNVKSWPHGTVCVPPDPPTPPIPLWPAGPPNGTSLWWSRHHVSNYLPPLTKDNVQLKAALNQLGWGRGAKARRQAALAGVSGRGGAGG